MAIRRISNRTTQSITSPFDRAFVASINRYDQFSEWMDRQLCVLETRFVRDHAGIGEGRLEDEYDANGLPFDLELQWDEF